MLKEQDHDLAIGVGMVDRVEEIAVCVQRQDHVQGGLYHLLCFCCSASCWYPHPLAVFCLRDPGLVHVDDPLAFDQEVKHAVGELLPLHQASGSVGVQSLLLSLFVSEIQILDEEPVDFVALEGLLHLLVHHLDHIGDLKDGLAVFDHLLRDHLQC